MQKSLILTILRLRDGVHKLARATNLTCAVLETMEGELNTRKCTANIKIENETLQDLSNRVSFLE